MCSTFPFKDRRRHYPPDRFSHIVIDECHRSAWGKWREVLERNRSKWSAMALSRVRLDTAFFDTP